MKYTNLSVLGISIDAYDVYRQTHKCKHEWMNEMSEK